MHDPLTTDTDRSTLFNERGLASDSVLFPGFAIEQALDASRSNGLLEPAAIHRVAIIGPGLDFIDKREGYDFYPEQTIQPFAVVEALVRLGLTAPAALRVTTFDVSARVNRHLDEAHRRARDSAGYVVHLPRRTDSVAWTPVVLRYWQTFGDRIGARSRRRQRRPPACSFAPFASARRSSTSSPPVI